MGTPHYMGKEMTIGEIIPYAYVYAEIEVENPQPKLIITISFRREINRILWTTVNEILVHLSTFVQK